MYSPYRQHIAPDVSDVSLARLRLIRIKANKLIDIMAMILRILIGFGVPLIVSRVLILINFSLWDSLLGCGLIILTPASGLVIILLIHLICMKLNFRNKFWNRLINKRKAQLIT